MDIRHTFYHRLTIPNGTCHRSLVIYIASKGRSHKPMWKRRNPPLASPVHAHNSKHGRFTIPQLRPYFSKLRNSMQFSIGRERNAFAREMPGKRLFPLGTCWRLLYDNMCWPIAVLHLGYSTSTAILGLEGLKLEA